MKKYLNKKASFEIASQSLLWIPRIFFLIVFLIVVLSPIGFYSKNKQNQLSILEHKESDLIIFEIKKCLEQGISEQTLDRCLNRQNIGLNIISDDISFILNQDKYEKEFCKLSKKYICKEETALIRSNNRLEKVFLDVVISLE
jgi:hypothetical protein